MSRELIESQVGVEAGESEPVSMRSSHEQDSSLGLPKEDEEEED